jgi:hypothetical protein
MAPQEWTETCSCEISSNNNCLIESCARLYILYIYILLYIEHIGDVSPEKMVVYCLMIGKVNWFTVFFHIHNLEAQKNLLLMVLETAKKEYNEDIIR